MHPSVYAAAFQRAADALGGALELSAYLSCSPARVIAWMTGHTLPPDHAFLKVVDLLTERGLISTRDQIAREAGPGEPAPEETS